MTNSLSLSLDSSAIISKVDWAGLAKQWIDMQSTTIMPQSMLFNEIQFIHQPQQLGHLQMNQLNQLNQILPPPPMHLNTFNLPPFSQPPIQNQHHFHPLDHQLQHLNNQFNHPATLLSQINPPPPINHHMSQQLNQPIGHQISNPPQFNPNLNQQQNFVPPPSNNSLRKEPPLLPPFELSLKTNQLNNNNQFNNVNRNKFNHSNNNFKKKNKNNADRTADLKFKKEASSDKSLYGDKSARHQSEAEKPNRNQKNSSNNNSETNQKHRQSKAPVNQLQFNQSANNNKVNQLIPNQLDQESGSTDESNSSIFDANKRKKLPEWIREGLEKMEKEKQKRIEKEENLIKKAKEEQLRRELELDDEDDDEEPEENPKSSSGHREEEPARKREIGEEKRKLFSSSFHQKTFADMFLVKKSKDYYYESEQEREKELMLRTRKVLTNILLEVTDGLVKQIASKCIQEAKIQKSKYPVARRSLSKALLVTIVCVTQLRISADFNQLGHVS